MTAVSTLDGVDLTALAARVGTPLYCYSAATIQTRIATLIDALRGLDAHVHYAVKANGNRAILELVRAAGLGVDIVSAGELRRCLAAGFEGGAIVFSGVGKTAAEIDLALAAGIARFNVESGDELDLLDRLAAARGVIASASARINPDVDARTHAKISTGKAENKFGVAIATARSWFATGARRGNVRLDGLHVHIGSELLDLAPFRAAFNRVARFWRELEADGHRLAVIDAGGGLGVGYRDGETPPSAAAYTAVLREELAGFSGRLLLEPGRWLVADAGVLLARVVRVKHALARSFVVLDAAMNDLARPALYDAWHPIDVLDAGARPRCRYDVVGPVCETGDTFARDRELPECVAGDLVAIGTAGAYGASMASTYNSRPLAAEVLLERGRYAVIRRRQTFAEMTAGESSANHWEAP